MDYRENKRVDEAISTIEWMKDRIEELENENEKLNEKNDELIYEIEVLNGTQ